MALTDQWVTEKRREQELLGNPPESFLPFNNADIEIFRLREQLAKVSSALFESNRILKELLKLAGSGLDSSSDLIARTQISVNELVLKEN